MFACVRRCGHTRALTKLMDGDDKIVSGDGGPNCMPPGSGDHSISRDDIDSTEVKDKALSHYEAMTLVKKSIAELLTDPLLSGLSEDVSLEELQDILHLEQGKAITLYLRRYDDSILRKLCAHCVNIIELLCSNSSVTRSYSRRFKESY